MGSALSLPFFFFVPHQTGTSLRVWAVHAHLKGLGVGSAQNSLPLRSLLAISLSLRRESTSQSILALGARGWPQGSIPDHLPGRAWSPGATSGWAWVSHPPLHPCPLGLLPTSKSGSLWRRGGAPGLETGSFPRAGVLLTGLAHPVQPFREPEFSACHPPSLGYAQGEN